MVTWIAWNAIEMGCCLNKSWLLVLPVIVIAVVNVMVLYVMFFIMLLVFVQLFPCRCFGLEVIFVLSLNLVGVQKSIRDCFVED